MNIQYYFIFESVTAAEYFWTAYAITPLIIHFLPSSKCISTKTSKMLFDLALQFASLEATIYELEEFGDSFNSPTQ